MVSMALQETACKEQQVENRQEHEENNVPTMKQYLTQEGTSDKNCVTNNQHHNEQENTSTKELDVVTDEICSGEECVTNNENNPDLNASNSSEKQILSINNLTPSVKIVDLTDKITNKMMSSDTVKEENYPKNQPEEYPVNEIDPNHYDGNSSEELYSYDIEENYLTDPNLIKILESYSSNLNNAVINVENKICRNDSAEQSDIDSNFSSKNMSTNSLDSDPVTGTVSTSNNFSEELENCEQNTTRNEHVVALLEQKTQQICELENTIKRLTDQVNHEAARSERLADLETLIKQKDKEIMLINKEHDIDKQSYGILKKEMENKCLAMKKNVDMANKDKESMVMKYAVSEKDLIDTRKEKETLSRKFKEMTKENESLNEKLKTLINDKSRLAQTLDIKSTELHSSHKEIEKLKEEVNTRDIKIKWSQNKLKSEMEIHQDCPGQIDKLMNKVRILEEELTASKTQCQTLQKELDESAQNKALETQLKEEQAKLIMERHGHSEIETKYKSLQGKYQSIIEENNSLSFQVQNLETERLELGKKLSSSREDTERLSNAVSDLRSRLVEMDSLISQLKQSEDKIDTMMNETEQVRHQNEELLQDMSSSRIRETDMLSFTQKLTTKNVQLQSEFTNLEFKAAELQKSDEKQRVEIRDLKIQLNEVQGELNKEKSKRDEETRILARQVAERTKRSEALETDLADTKSNLTHSKIKHSIIVKELQKELSLLQKKINSLEESGTSSQVGVSQFVSLLSPQACNVPKEVLVERLLKHQADLVKSNEKIEFLEDHARQLLDKVQKQSRLLQSYMLREEAGALAPSFLDKHKTETTKHGGFMASLYSRNQPDDGMSLELSLEINKKLQAVLEDILLKNIMLKESMDTLGDEIERLKKEK